MTKLREGTYLMFIALLIIPKGLGFYEGQPFYTACFILAFIALAISLSAGLLTNAYNTPEILILTVSFTFGCYTFLVTRDKSILILIGTILGIKNVPTHRVTRTMLYIWTGTFVLMSLKACKLGETGLVVTSYKFGQVVDRYSMGYPHPNVLHITYLTIASLILIVMNQYNTTKSHQLTTLILLSLGNLLIFAYTLSYTGFISTSLLIVLNIATRNRNLHTCEKLTIFSTVPICAYTSLVLPLQLNSSGRAFQILDKILNGRYRVTKFYISSMNLSLLPRPIEIQEGYAIDCSYTEAILSYGALFFSMLMVGYSLTVLNLLKNRRYTELVVLVVLLIAGISEPFLFNTSSKNITLIYLGECLFDQTSRLPNLLKFRETSTNELRLRQSIIRRTK